MEAAARSPAAASFPRIPSASAWNLLSSSVNRGITVTAGLPVIFTTPAHGTAYDIAGTGKAQTGALAAALDVAARLATLENRPS